MRLGIDAREIQNGVTTAMGQAIYNFLSYYDRILSKDRCILFSSKPVPFQFSEKVRNYVMDETFVFWWEQVQLPAAARQAQVEVLFSPHARVPLRGVCKRIGMVRDLVRHEFPPYRHEMSLPEFLYDRFFVKRTVSAAEKIMAMSHVTRDAVVRLYGTDRRKIEVIPPGISAALRPDPDADTVESFKMRLGILGPYLLFSGTFERHKNVEALIRAFGILAARHPDLILVLAGPQDTAAADLGPLVSREGLQKKVRFVAGAGDAATRRLLYGGAEVFVMPSLYETFDLASLEAMACGTPVVSSNTASLSEIMDGAALLADAARPEALAEGIERALTDKVLRAGLRARGLRRAEALAEGTMAKRMFDFFYDIAGY